MSDKSPRQGKSPKSAKSLKEKRADKRGKAAGDTSAISEPLNTKRR